METESSSTTMYHGGRLAARRLKEQGVSKLFTLSGGHLFSIYDGCRDEGIEIVDTRHEQAATFAAEGWAKITREPGVAALTAGPGVTNGMSAIGSALQNQSPILVLGGRAPAMRWGMGSLQEIDHIPFVAPLTKSARTAETPGEIPELIDEALTAALTPHSGPTFIDFPLDIVFSEGEEVSAPAKLPDATLEPAAPSGIDEAVALLAKAERPVIMAGTNLWWGHGEKALLELVNERRIPVFLNGLARGCVPADHDLFFARARGEALQGADVALVIGVPMDFRLGFGGSFGEETKILVVDRAEPQRPHPREVAAECYGGIGATLAAIREGTAGLEDSTAPWISQLRSSEDEKRAAETADLEDDRAPLHPMRIYHELNQFLDRDAIVIGDGGDFVSFAGKVINSYEPGCWLDPGPFGCLGSGTGYALAAKLAHPDRQ
ncbi:MAG: acetolactate synthase, partial [Actinobacteria bacterium]|nr:acetolactate synthase [Actinomycetota bacterium]